MFKDFNANGLTTKEAMISVIVGLATVTGAMALKKGTELAVSKIKKVKAGESEMIPVVVEESKEEPVVEE